MVMEIRRSHFASINFSSSRFMSHIEASTEEVHQFNEHKDNNLRGEIDSNSVLITKKRNYSKENGYRIMQSIDSCECQNNNPVFSNPDIRSPCMCPISLLFSRNSRPPNLCGSAVT